MNWLPIKNYEGLYEVSDDGRVRSVDRNIQMKNGKTRLFKGKELALNLNKKVSYLQTILYKENQGKTFYVHQLVANAFIPNPSNLPEVNHIDGVRVNNSVFNLEWVDRKGNALHAVNTGLRKYQNKVTEEDFKKLLDLVILEGKSYEELTKVVPYKVPFLSTKLKKIARSLGKSQELREALMLQKTKRNQKVSATQRLQIGMFSVEGTHIKTFPSVEEAYRYVTEELNIKTSSGSISNAANPNQTQKTAGGFQWKYI